MCADERPQRRSRAAPHTPPIPTGLLWPSRYGVDAYHDVCGKDRDDKSPCFNTLDDDSGSFIDEAAQAEYGANLTREIQAHRSDGPECAHVAVGDTKCACAGGFIMSWVDEFWKGAKVQAGCKPAYPDPDFSTSTCDDKARAPTT